MEDSNLRMKKWLNDEFFKKTIKGVVTWFPKKMKKEIEMQEKQKEEKEQKLLNDLISLDECFKDLENNKNIEKIAKFFFSTTDENKDLIYKALSIHHSKTLISLHKFPGVSQEILRVYKNLFKTQLSQE